MSWNLLKNQWVVFPVEAISTQQLNHNFLYSYKNMPELKVVDGSIQVFMFVFVNPNPVSITQGLKLLGYTILGVFKWCPTLGIKQPIDNAAIATDRFCSGLLEPGIEFLCHKLLLQIQLCFNYHFLLIQTAQLDVQVIII